MMVGEPGRQRNVLKSDVKKKSSLENRGTRINILVKHHRGWTPEVFRKLFISLGVFSVENSKEFFFPSPPYLLAYVSELAFVQADCLLLIQNWIKNGLEHAVCHSFSSWSGIPTH